MGLSLNMSSSTNSNISSLLSSLNVNSPGGQMASLTNSVLGNNGSGISVSDYAMIKNGSYYSLLKAYYSETGANSTQEGSSGSEVSELLGMNKDKDKTESAGSANSGSGTGSTQSATGASSDSTAENAALQSASSNLSSASKALSTTGEKSLFLSSTGNNSSRDASDYNMDAIYEGITDFVKDYNSLIKTAADSKNSRVLTNAASMMGTVQSNENLLARVGITMDKEDYLQVNEEKLKSADVGTLKLLFNDKNSMGSKVGDYADTIMNATKADVQKASGIYNSTGSYQTSDPMTSTISSYT